MDEYPGFGIAEAEGRVLVVSALSDTSSQAPLDAVFAKAHFKTMMHVSAGRFQESGCIDFPGTDCYLIVSTTEPGTSSDAPDGTSTASMIWHIMSGGGRFKGAQGQITGNSVGTADGRFTDHQVCKIKLAD
jgi:hypothetical protein